MNWRHHTSWRVFQRGWAALMLAILVCELFGYGLIVTLTPKEAIAAQSTIDSAVDINGAPHTNSGSKTVFVSDSTGYKFYEDLSGACVYSKTTDGGTSWNTAVTVDAQTDCIGIQVWYDRWTPGDSGDYIHILTMDTSVDDLFYNRLDTGNGDTLLMGTTPIDVSTNSGNSVAAMTEGSNYPSLTKATDGTVYFAVSDATDSYVVECSSNCNLATSWTETGTMPFDLADDPSILVPLAGGDIMLINRDVSAEVLRYKNWNNTSWDGSWTTIDGAATDNTTYDVGMSAVVSVSTGDVYLAYIARNAALGTDDQIRTARYGSGSWTATKEAVRYTEQGLTSLAIALDASNDDVYVAYGARTNPASLPTGNIYWKISKDNMSSWSLAQGPVNASPDDMYGVDLNASSDERIFVSWFDNTDDDIDGDTIANIFSGITVASQTEADMVDVDTYTQSTIDNAVDVNGAPHINAGSKTVFVSDTVGYKFYEDSTGPCVYSKTTDGGTSWNTAVTVDAQTDCIGIQVWYDRWTPGDSGDYIHIATMDIGNDDIWYNRLDTTSDSLLLGSSPVSALTGTGQGGTSLTEGENVHAITKGTDGTIYMVSNDGTGVADSFVLECTTSCNSASNWTETGINPMDLASDYNLIVPLPGGNIMLINRDISAGEIRQKIWNNSAWDGSWTTIDATASSTNVTYDVGMSAVVSVSTGDVYLAYIANNVTLGTDDQIRTARYSGGSWTQTGLLFEGLTLRTPTNVAIGLDQNTDTAYVAYSARATIATAASAQVLFKYSQDGMNTWSTERGPVNTSTDDIYGVDINNISADRLYVSWFDNTDNDIYGATLADLPITLQTTGGQISAAGGGSTDVYIGGTFTITNTNDSGTINVTGITLTENGTIDAFADIANVDLFYEMDNSAPYNCASESYSGGETQFGVTDTNGFSGADGVSSFSGTSVGVSTGQALCVYAVMDILDGADGNATIEIAIQNPVADVSISSGSAGPSAAQAIPGTTIIENDMPTLTHFHWRNDNGDESGATSVTGGNEDTAYAALQRMAPARVRLQVSNEGNVTTPGIQYRLEYAENPSACDAATGWTDVGAGGGHFDMYDSSNLTDGQDTTNISTASGGLTDENISFLAPNGGVKDTSSQTSSITLSTTEFVELEYSIAATMDAIEGNSYCFRVTDAGTPLAAYALYARANIIADVTVSVLPGSQQATTTTPVTDLYIGSGFMVTENVSARNVTGVTVTENGTVDASTGLENVRLFYDTDTSMPYDCASESYDGGESQFGATDTDGFTGPNGTSTFSDSVAISTTSTMCLYIVLDTTSVAQNDETIHIAIENPSSNLTVSSGSVSPSITRSLNASTTLVGAILTQTHYHFRNDNGSEASSTSMTEGIEDTPIANISDTTPVRLRMQVSNEGSVTSAPYALRLEYGPKITVCSAVSSWVDVGASGGAWEMYNSPNITNGSDATNIATSTGGVTDENTNFITSNGGLRDTSSVLATTTIASDEYLEAEFSIIQTNEAGYDVPYCFRIASSEVALNAYTHYPEITTAPERDFEVQRGTFTMATATTTLVAGVDYIAPASNSSAFIRITNTHHTGAGRNLGGGNQNTDDISVYISDASNITNSVDFARMGVGVNTRVSWEIVEFIGEPGSDNEMIVRGQNFATYGSANLTVNGGSLGSIDDDADVAVFITGQASPDVGTANYASLQSTSEWDAGNNQPVFTRGDAGGDAVRVSYAVVEFTGVNWFVQRSEHTYTNAGTTETEPITAVNSISRTFLHTQKRNMTGLNGVDEFGAEVWLSSIGQVSYFLQSGASTSSGQTSVAWIIENIQTSAGAMEVTRSNGNSTGGAEPLTLSVPIGKTLVDITNASIFVNNRAVGTGANQPRAIMGVTIASSTHYQLWRSDTGAAVDYRTEIVEWPTAGLAIRQNYYRIYSDNGALLPTDPWPVGASDLGENTVLTNLDEPLGESERVRIRMSLRAMNANFPVATKGFKLQYGEMTTTCSAIDPTGWFDVGDSASSTIWRGYDVGALSDDTQLSIDPPGGGDLVLSVSDVAGTFEEANDTPANLYAVSEGEDIEYDWVVEQNGADAETYYCFRMIESNGTILAKYNNYPQLRTASFAPRSQNWRWYEDETQETPVVPLAIENVAPVNIANESPLTLRITVGEIENIARDDVRFKLQYSEYADFAEVYDVAATSTCTATSTWCYVEGGGTDNAQITTALLSDADSCTGGVGDGCGTHNTSPYWFITGIRHQGNAAAEYGFTLKSAGPHVNRVYYFRLFDVVQDIPVPVNSGESYPSLATEGASLTFDMEGISSGQTIEGVTVDITTTPSSLAFGLLEDSEAIEGAHRLTVDANATEGYSILMYMDGDLMNEGGSVIRPITGSNAAPVAWNTGCTPTAPSCLGYHVGDDTLEGGSPRFAAPDTFAAVSTTTPEEVAYSSQPIVNESTDILYRIMRRGSQEPGNYEARIRYISVPEF